MTWDGFLTALFLMLSSRITLMIFVAAYMAFVIADLFKRHLLSNGFVYYLTVLLSPVAFAASAAALVDAFGHLESVGFGNKFLTLIGALILMTLIITIYIRAHIKPVDKTSGELAYASPARISISAAKRLIGTGTSGMVIFGLIAIAVLVVAINYFVVIMELLPLILIALIALFIPGANIIAIIFLFCVGVVSGTVIGFVCTAFVIAMLMSLLVTNGCIRYILTTNKTKGQKALFIFLSFIPIYNVVYGIHSLLKSREN